jgi:hypothetical protein
METAGTKEQAETQPDNGTGMDGGGPSEAGIAGRASPTRQPGLPGPRPSLLRPVGQVANVFTASQLSNETLLKAINAKLPEDVCVRELVEVPQSFDANKDAVRKM